MKINCKKFLSLFLAVLMISTGIIPALAAEKPFTDSRRGTVPVVYIHGYGDYIHKDKNDINSEKIYSGDGDMISKETIDAALAGIKEPLLKGIKTDEWQDYSDFLVNTFEKDLSRMKLDNNGEASDGSGNTCRQNFTPGNYRGKDGKYDLFAYEMRYDWRLDPVEIADLLNMYIKNVKKATGYSKVNLVGRCLGSNVVLAYLEKYGYEDINAIEFYIGLFGGIDLVGALFSGLVDINPRALYRFVEQYVPDDGEDMSVLKAVLSLLNVLNGLNLPIELVYKVYEEIYQDVIPRMVMYSFGTMPALWSFVGDEYYEAAKELVFGNQEEKYAGLIKKIDYYHYNVQIRNKEIVADAIANGVNVYNFSKYGGTMVPVCKEAMLTNDNVVTVKNQNFGAVASPVNRPFNFIYINNLNKNGGAGYLSPDNYVDASGDMLRDHVWFIRGSSHAIMPHSINNLMANVFEANGYTGSTQYVTTDYFENYPQFMIAYEDTYGAEIYPLTKENLDKMEPWHQHFFDRFLFLLQKIFDFVTDLVRSIHGAVED